MFEAAVADYPPAPASLTCARFSSTSHMGSAKEGKGALWRTTEVPGGIVRSSSNTPLAQGNSSDYTEGLLWFGVCSPEQLEEAQAEYVCCVGGDCVCRTAQHRRAPLLVFTCRRRRTTPCLSRFRVCPQPPQPKRQPTGRPTKDSTPATASAPWKDVPMEVDVSQCVVTCRACWRCFMVLVMPSSSVQCVSSFGCVLGAIHTQFYASATGPVQGAG
mgnify:CR=1 FL=1